MCFCLVYFDHCSSNLLQITSRRCLAWPVQDSSGQQYGGGNFECQPCYSRDVTIGLSMLLFLANLVAVLAAVISALLSDWGADELEAGDIVKVRAVGGKAHADSQGSEMVACTGST